MNQLILSTNYRHSEGFYSKFLSVLGNLPLNVLVERLDMHLPACRDAINKKYPCFLFQFDAHKLLSNVLLIIKTFFFFFFS